MAASSAGMLHWVAGYPKSGTTMVRAILNGLIQGVGPDTDAKAIMAFDRRRMSSINTFYRAAFGKNNRASNWSEMYERARRAQALATRGQDIFVKTHTANTSFRDVSFIDWERTASFIYVVRDPRDILSSYAHHFSISLDEAVQSLNNDDNCHGHSADSRDGHFAEPMLSWRLNVSSWSKTPCPNFILLRYEDMVADRRRVAALLNDFYRFGRSTTDLDRIAALTDFDGMKAAERKEGFAEAIGGRAFFREGRAGGWRDLDYDRYIAPIEEKHGDVMRQLKYLDAPP